MEKKELKYFKKTDIIVILVILAIAVGAFFTYNAISAKKDNDANKASVKAEIYYNSKLVKTISLSEGKKRVFSVAEVDSVKFEIDEKGNIRFLSSDCRDQICVKSGKLHRVGDFAACLPNGLVLKIVSEGERPSEEPDTVI